MQLVLCPGLPRRLPQPTKAPRRHGALQLSYPSPSTFANVPIGRRGDSRIAFNPDDSYIAFALVGQPNAHRARITAGGAGGVPAFGSVGVERGC